MTDLWIFESSCPNTNTGGEKKVTTWMVSSLMLEHGTDQVFSVNALFLTGFVSHESFSSPEVHLKFSGGKS